MRGAYWIYLNKLATPLYFRDFERVLMALSSIRERCMIDICCGYDVYRVNSMVMQRIANNFIANQVTVVSFCGESYPLETVEDILSFLRKTKSERFFIDGEIIKAFTNPVKEI